MTGRWLVARALWIGLLLGAVAASPFVFALVDLYVTLWVGMAVASLLPLDSRPQRLVDGLAYAWVLISVAAAVGAVALMFGLLAKAYTRFGPRRAVPAAPPERSAG